MPHAAKIIWGRYRCDDCGNTWAGAAHAKGADTCPHCGHEGQRPYRSQAIDANKTFGEMQEDENYAASAVILELIRSGYAKGANAGFVLAMEEELRERIRGWVDTHYKHRTKMREKSAAIRVDAVRDALNAIRNPAGTMHELWQSVIDAIQRELTDCDAYHAVTAHLGHGGQTIHLQAAVFYSTNERKD